MIASRSRTESTVQIYGGIAVILAAVGFTLFSFFLPDASNYRIQHKICLGVTIIGATMVGNGFRKKDDSR